MSKINQHSVLVAGVPVSRGHPDHIEHDDMTAFCQFVGEQVVEMHTPQNYFARVHELMHTQHTSKKHEAYAYGRVNTIVREITEDIRLHVHHWPWRERQTPKIIAEATKKWLSAEKRAAVAHLKKKPEDRGTWPDFSFRLRQLAVTAGVEGWWKASRDLIRKAGFQDYEQKKLAQTALELIRQGKEKAAAEMLQRAFFGELTEKKTHQHKLPPGIELEGTEGDETPAMGDDTDEDDACDGSENQPHMDIIELPHEVKIDAAKVGWRRGTTGSRMHRPSLRKPVLPQRLFVKRNPTEPGGTILIDASGSMGDFDQITKWCEQAPFGTVAYYAGCDSGGSGQLFIYARGGRRALEIVEPDHRGNLVDGPAMDWLLSQKKPRIMVTDRGFCGASDSVAQTVRLRQLERQGQIKVANYKKRIRID